ncbi:MAG: ATP synthase F0 subunit B [Myxococcota bacterium]
MEIIPDPIHVALLTAPFLVAMVSLHLILWKPLLAYLDERDGVSTRARHEAHELEGAASEQLSKIEARLVEARLHVGSLRQQARSRALVKENEILAEARSSTDRRVEQALSQIGAEKQGAASALHASAAELSNQMAAQVLGRPVS